MIIYGPQVTTWVPLAIWVRVWSKNISTIKNIMIQNKKPTRILPDGFFRWKVNRSCLFINHYWIDWKEKYLKPFRIHACESIIASQNLAVKAFDICFWHTSNYHQSWSSGPFGRHRQHGSRPFGDSLSRVPQLKLGTAKPCCCKL